MKGLNKTLKNLAQSEANEKRTIFESVIRWQPQFLHQKPYIPYFWSLYPKRGDTYEDCIKFSVTDSDRLIFPELKGVKVVKLRTGNGRVSEVK